MPDCKGREIAYGDRVKIMAGNGRGRLGIVAYRVYGHPNSPWWIQTWPAMSLPDSAALSGTPLAQRGKMDLVSNCEENLKRLTRRCVECSAVCPENDYLCKECRD